MLLAETAWRRHRMKPGQGGAGFFDLLEIRLFEDSPFDEPLDQDGLAFKASDESSLLEGSHLRSCEAEFRKVAE